MIVSIHIPKTAGTSFGFRLAALFGPRLLKDYGDWVGYDTFGTVIRRRIREVLTRARRGYLLHSYDVIHGHFVASKYENLFPNTKFVAFFRDPYQQAVSNYRFLLRHPEINHPGVRAFHRTKPTIQEFIAAIPSAQAVYLGKLLVEDFAMVGLTEQYERSVALFEAVFRCALPPVTERGNVNPERSAEAYEIEPEVRRAVERHRSADIEVYYRAKESFAALCACHGL